MQTTPENASLLEELYERASIVADLDGPQLEAWVSGLFPVFDDDMSLGDFVAYCADRATERGALLVAAIAELSKGLDPTTAELAQERLAADLLPAWAAGIGASELTGAWTVTAPFGRSIVLGFDAPRTGAPMAVSAQTDTRSAVADSDLAGRSDEAIKEYPDGVKDDEEAAEDLRHSILVDLSANGELEDIQLAGDPETLLEEAKASGERVRIEEMDPDDAVAAVVGAWPAAGTVLPELGPGSAANQQFVRRRLLTASGHVLAPMEAVEVEVDIRRGLDDQGFADANRAALSTMQSAVGFADDAATAAANAAPQLVEAWISVVTGTVAAELSPRERDALLWLEWADWLGAGIGLLRAGAGTTADGATLVDHVNRCPEVSSSISKGDRDYAEWAFDVALDLLEDLGVVTEDRQLTDAGYQALWVGLEAAWSPEQP